MAEIGTPLRKVKIIPLTEPVRGPEPERGIPAPRKEPAIDPVKVPEKIDG